MEFWTRLIFVADWHRRKFKLGPSLFAFGDNDFDGDDYCVRGRPPNDVAVRELFKTRDEFISLFLEDTGYRR